jgi:hypothetical protein
MNFENTTTYVLTRQTLIQQGIIALTYAKVILTKFDGVQFVAQSVCIEATIVGLLGPEFKSRLKPCRCIRVRHFFGLFLIFLNDLFQFSRMYRTKLEEF